MLRDMKACTNSIRDTAGASFISKQTIPNLFTTKADGTIEEGLRI